MEKETIKLDKNLAKKVDMSTETDSEAVVDKMSELAEENETLKAKVEEYKTKEEEQNKTRATTLVENAIKKGKIKPEQKESYINMAVSNYDDVKSMFDGIVERKSISQQIQSGKATNSADDRSTWSLIDWSKKDPKGLAEMRTNDPESFEALSKK